MVEEKAAIGQKKAPDDLTGGVILAGSELTYGLSSVATMNESEANEDHLNKPAFRLHH